MQTHHDHDHDHRSDDRGVSTTFTGRSVLDEHGLSLGSITDVVYDDRGIDPEYLVVDPGLFRAAHYVPVDGAYETSDGKIVVAWDKFWFKQAPKAPADHILTPVDRHELEIHYT